MIYGAKLNEEKIMAVRSFDLGNGLELIFVWKRAMHLVETSKGQRRTYSYRLYKIDERYHQYTPKSFHEYKGFESWESAINRASKKYGEPMMDTRNEWALNQ